MLKYSMNVLKQLLLEKKWNTSDLAREYAKYESPELSPDEAIKKYGSMVRKALNNPDSSRYGTVKKLVEVLGGELIIRVKRTEDLSL